MIDQIKQLIAQDESAQDTAHEHIEITRDWLLLFGAVTGVAVIFVLLAGVAATAAAPVWVVLPLLVAFGFAAIAAMITLRALEYARYTLGARFEEWRENQAAAREVARITATQITNVNVKGRQNVVTVGGQTVANERILPVYISRYPVTRLIENVPSCDLAYFIDRMMIAGWSKRVWLGQTLPSGKLVSTFADYDQIIAPLVKANVIVERGERSAGKLTLTDANEIKARLGLPTGDVNESQDAENQNQIEGETQRTG